MSYIVYVIRDESGKQYTGYTNNDARRLWQHNNGITKTTKPGINWQFVYKKVFGSKTEAIKHERYLKTGKEREFISKSIKPRV